MSRPLVAGVAAAVYLVLIASASPVDVATALLLGGAVALWTRRGPSRPSFARWRGAPRLVAGATRAIVRGAWQVLQVLLGLASSRRAGYVQVPRGERTDEGVLVTGLVMTMSPGTVFVRLDEAGERLLFTAVDASDPAAVRDEIDEFYRRSQRGSVP